MPSNQSRERMRRYAVIMAGGFGTRFWPRSRRGTPKQFLAIAGRRTMLQETVRRLRGIVPERRVLTVASAEHKRLIRAQLPDLPAANVVIEPAARGTAACLALTAERIARQDSKALMAVFPADHVITQRPAFACALRRAFAIAANERCLVTFGIAPTAPETGYGYIEVGAPLAGAAPRAYWATRFHEKPDAPTAQAYVQAGRFLWNSGMFVWRVDVFRAALARHAPEIARAVQGAGRGGSAVRERLYRRLPVVSIDVALMERAERVAVVEGNFGWSDVGSWAAMGALWGTDAAGNACQGNAMLIECRDSVVAARERLIAVVGVDGLVVVDSPDAVLVCAKSRSQDIRRVVDALAHSRYRHLL